MKKGQFTAEQIVSLLRQAETGEKTIQELCRDKGLSDATFYRWRRQYSGVNVNEARRIKEITAENGRLKKLLAERDLEVDALRDLLQKK